MLARTDVGAAADAGAALDAGARSDAGPDASRVTRLAGGMVGSQTEPACPAVEEWSGGSFAASRWAWCRPEVVVQAAELSSVGRQLLIRKTDEVARLLTS